MKIYALLAILALVVIEVLHRLTGIGHLGIILLAALVFIWWKSDE